MKAPYARTSNPNGWKAAAKLEATSKEWTETEKLLRRMLELVVGAAEAEAELRDMANSSIAGGSVSLGRSASPTSATHELGISDMTGATAVSPTHRYMRRQLLLASAEMPQLRHELRPVLKRLEKTRGILMEAIPTALDADLRDRLAHVKETAEGYKARHRRPA